MPSGAAPSASGGEAGADAEQPRAGERGPEQGGNAGWPQGGEQTVVIAMRRKKSRMELIEEGKRACEVKF